MLEPWALRAELQEADVSQLGRCPHCRRSVDAARKRLLLKAETVSTRPLVDASCCSYPPATSRVITASGHWYGRVTTGVPRRGSAPEKDSGGLVCSVVTYGPVPYAGRWCVRVWCWNRTGGIAENVATVSLSAYCRAGPPGTQWVRRIPPRGIWIGVCTRATTTPTVRVVRPRAVAPEAVMMKTFCVDGRQSAPSSSGLPAPSWPLQLVPALGDRLMTTGQRGTWRRRAWRPFRYPTTLEYRRFHRAIASMWSVGCHA